MGNFGGFETYAQWALDRYARAFGQLETLVDDEIWPDRSAEERLNKIRQVVTMLGDEFKREQDGQE